MKEALIPVFPQSSEEEEKVISQPPSLRRQISWAKSYNRSLKRKLAKIARQEKRLEKLDKESAILRERLDRKLGVQS